MDAREAIRVARIEAGLSKRELARRAGTSPAAIVAYESGDRQPGFATFERLVRAAGFELRVQIRAVPPERDWDRANRLLEDVLDLAQHLPTKPARRSIPFPPFAEGVQ